MGPTLNPETSAFKLQTPGKFPEEYKLHSEHGESLKTTRVHLDFPIPVTAYQVTILYIAGIIITAPGSQMCTSSMLLFGWLRDGRSEDRIPVGGEILRTCPDRPWSSFSLLYSGYQAFPGGKERPGRDADP